MNYKIIQETNVFLNELKEIKYKTLKSRKKFERGRNFINLPCSLDLKVTNVDCDKVSFMYAFTICIGGKIFFGREWSQFDTIIKGIVDVFKLNLENNLVIYVPNLSYVTQFIRKRVEIETSFSVSERQPLELVLSNGIVLKCVEFESGYKTCDLCKHVYSEKIDYVDVEDKIRTPLTKLSDVEIEYCVQDCYVTYVHVKEQMEFLGNITRLKVTSTSYVREFCRSKCFSSENSLTFFKKISELKLDKLEYVVNKKSFYGGYVYSNPEYRNCLLDDVYSYDFISAYASILCTMKFPMGKGTFVKIRNKREFEYYMEKYLCVFPIKFSNLKVKGKIPLLSSNNCEYKKDVISDDDKIIEASEIKLYINSVDFETIKETYSFDDFSVDYIYYYYKDFLPKPFIECILELFKNKNELKGSDDEQTYAHLKALLNGIYGVCVTDPVMNNISYNFDQWCVEESKIEDALKKYNESKTRFTFYGWGVFCTSYCRKNLFYVIKKIEDDFVYSDTDSIKFLNIKKNKKYFDMFNKENLERIKEVCSYHNLNIEDFRPLTFTKERKILGDFDYEGCSELFKTVGSKKYLQKKDGKITITVSGCGKEKATKYLTNKYKNDRELFFNFNNDLEIPKEYSGKIINKHIDFETKGKVVDYQGNSYNFNEKTSIFTEKVPFNFNKDFELVNDMINLVKGFKEIKNKKASV